MHNLFHSAAVLLAFLSLNTWNFANEAISWRNNLDSAKVEAAQNKKLVLLHFYTTTCGPCRILDQNVFSVPQVGDAVERNYVPMKVDAGISPALAQAYQIQTVPADIILSPEGGVVARLSCPQNPNEYLEQLTNLSQQYQLHAAKQGSSSHGQMQAAYAGLQVGRYPQQTGTSPTPNAAAPTPAHNPAAFSNPYTQNQAVTQSAPPANLSAMGPAGTTTVPANAMPKSYRNYPVADSSMAPSAGGQASSATQPAPAMVQNQFAAGGSQQTANQASSASAGQIRPTSHQSIVQRLPPGCPPLAFDGYCPVSLKRDHKWVEGNPQFGAIHRGRTFLFAAADQREQFLGNPDAYCPVFSGMDPVLLLDENRIEEGTRKFGFDYRGAFYLFANAQSMNQFKSQPDKYAAGVRQAMARMETSAAGTMLK